MNKKIDRIEERLRVLFEEKLPKIFTGHKTQRTLVDELIQVMQDNIQEDSEGQLYAPDLYILTVHPDDLIDWQVHQDILIEISITIQEIGAKEGFSFLKPTKIELYPDKSIRRGRFVVSAYFSLKEPGLPDTSVMARDEQVDQEYLIPENAMLIISGKSFFPLEKPVIDIGRHSSNDLVLSDPHVSRHHAQLRVIKNHYVIFDVGSMAGLYLNEKRISQATLHAGDVIRIGSVTLIYNQEPTNTFPTSIMQIDDNNIPPGEEEA